MIVQHIKDIGNKHLYKILLGQRIQILLFHQLLVYSVHFQQFKVFSGLYNSPVFHHTDEIGVLDRRESVSDRDSGPSLHGSVQRFLDQFFGLRVERGSGLVE